MKKKWKTQVVSFLAAANRETERIDEALNSLEESGWQVDDKRYGIALHH